MFRAFLSSMVVVAFLAAGIVRSDDAKDQKNSADQQGRKATITKVDKQGGNLTVKMKDKNGKEVEKTLKLTQDIRMVDSTGRVVAIDVFQTGNEILVVEREGKLSEIRQRKNQQNNQNNNQQNK